MTPASGTIAANAWQDTLEMDSFVTMNGSTLK